MDENASKAVFLGVSVFVAIITITLIVNFYTTARNSAAVANRYDITLSDDSKINEILSKKEITGMELRYILNYCSNNSELEILVYKDGAGVDIDTEEYWSDANQQELDSNIRPNYVYELDVDENELKVTATFLY